MEGARPGSVMKPVQIGSRLAGPGQPCFIIAEAGVNHNGSLETALKLVDVAVDAGADAVKFQKRELSRLYPAELLQNPNAAEWAFQYMLPVLKQSELSTSDFEVIKQHCDRRKIRMMCTPWDEASLDFLEKLGLEVYKVASADLVNLPLLERIAAAQKPMILSTGMATLREIEQAVAFLKRRKASFALLHCVSTYPAPFESLNLRFMETLKQFGVPVGYSGHERGIAIGLVAMVMGACIIEKHITLDRSMPGPDHPASLEPQGIQRLVRDIRHAELAMGSNQKRLSSMEMINRQVLRKSLVAAHPLTKGTVVTREMVAVKGPGKGLSPQRMEELIGVCLERDIRADECFSEGDLRPTGEGRISTKGLKRRWGLKARFHDLAEILKHKPPLVEFHLSEEDVRTGFDGPPEPYPQQLFVHAPEFADRRLLDLCSGDDAQRERSIELIQKTIDLTSRLQRNFSGGPAGVVIHVGGMTMDQPVQQTDHLLERAVQAFRRLESRGLVLLPENLPPRPWYLGGQWFQNHFIRAEEMVAFCRELKTGMTLDLSHAQLYCNVYGQDLSHYVRTCLPLVQHLHAADASGIDAEGLQIGEGVVNWEEILDLLSGHDFTWVPEIWSGHLQGAAGFIEAVNRLGRFQKL